MHFTKTLFLSLAGLIGFNVCGEELLHYKMNELSGATSIIDESSAETPIGTRVYTGVPGIGKGALQLTKSQKINLPVEILASLTDKVSIAFWVKNGSGLAGGATIFGAFTEAGNTAGGRILNVHA